VETLTSLRIQADRERIFRLAAAVEDWPRILPHYRWVRVLDETNGGRVVEMAARRGAIPVRWIAEQRVDPRQAMISFQHVGGLTRGMLAVWTFSPKADGTVVVRIWHQFCPGWPLVPDWLIHLVVGRFFVDHIAGRTLRRIGDLA
jgi:ribosome-associated toxin RatA of RatAB toxin-antitoxin module